MEGEKVVKEKSLTNGNTVYVPPQDGWSNQNNVEKEEIQCGIGSFKPKWIQVLASKQVFLCMFCITWVLQGIFPTYFVSIITTLEKLYNLQSKQTGLILSATEIGQTTSALLLPYLASQGHRPRWIASMMVLFSVFVLMCSLPHFIFDSPNLQNAVVGNSTSFSPNMCDLSYDAYLNITNSNMTIPDSSCTDNLVETSRVYWLTALLFISMLGCGVAQTTVYTLGIPYMDDNVASRESPIYFAITIGVRILGPSLGFILGSLCIRVYIDLSRETTLMPSDPRWVGAWWLGFIIIPSLLVVASIAMFAFPQKLSTYRSVTTEKKSTAKSLPKSKDFLKTLRRLLKNDVLVLRTSSSVLHILPIAGIYTFLPKYLESQFHLPAHAANLYSATGGIMVMGVGIIISGIFILKVKPRARMVAGWIAFVAIVYTLCMIALTTIDCANDGDVDRVTKLLKASEDCSADCVCNLDHYDPVCGNDGQTYYSPCEAGCTNATYVEGIIVSYSECDCMGSLSKEQRIAHIGSCVPECESSFYAYLLIFSFSAFIHATSEVGSMLLTLRCVDPRDKAMALGLIQFAIGLFANIPCTIIYGALVDHACLIWEQVCGDSGACKLYDNKVFRRWFHGVGGLLMFLGFICDFFVWNQARRIDFSEENDKVSQEEELNPFTAKTRSETSV